MVNEVLSREHGNNYFGLHEMNRADLPEAAKRALQEAKLRREKEQPTTRPKELGGGKGPEPTRFGDWEKKGIASDF
jgi:hypothetical protein